MKYTRKYLDVSGFTQPEDVVIEKLGVCSEMQFSPAVDNGDGTYTANFKGSGITFEDGLGFYLAGGTDELVLTKLTTGEAISGTIENGENVFHYTGYLILDSECACVINIEEYKALLGHEVWLGFSEYPINIETSTGIPIAYLGMYHFSETRQNEIYETPDIYLANLPGYMDVGLLPIKVRSNGDGTYTTYDGQTTYSASTTNITHPYKEKTDYIFKIMTPGVALIKGNNKCAYNQPRAYASAVTLTISGTDNYACTIPMSGNVLDITQEQLRKISVRFLPDICDGSMAYCDIRFDGVSGYTVERDESGAPGSMLSVSKSGNYLRVGLESGDVKGYRNDVLHVTFNSNTSTGLIRTYYWSPR
jgi:hypothetical protein